MISYPAFVIILLMSLFLGIGTACGNTLDVYRTHEPYPVKSLLSEETHYNLGRIAKVDLGSVLKVYLREEKKHNSQEEKNLFALAIGFLYMQNENYHAAMHWFDKKIVGNFVLEDYRLYFWAQTLKAYGEKKYADNHYSQAIQLISHAIELNHRIDQLFPDSPFRATLQRDTALMEQQLGDIQFKRFNYKAAWRFYRLAIMRDYEGKDARQSQLILSLARTYEAGGELESALDMLINLTDSSPEYKEELTIFLRKHEQNLTDTGINTQHLRTMLSKSSLTQTGTPELEDNKFVSEHPDILEFYDTVGQGETLEVLEKGLILLTRYPGRPETPQIIQKLDQAIIQHLDNHSWPVVLDAITRLYPPEKLSRLGLYFWRAQKPEIAAEFYKKIIEQYPLRTGLSHKAIYFLGRIYEDIKNYDVAIGHYSRLIDEYSDGPYTTAALFKIPWIMRLQGNFQEATKNFDRLIDFYSSKTLASIQEHYPDGNGFLSAAYYWQAQTLAKLQNPEGEQRYLEKLILEFPWDFYSMLARENLNLSLRDFLLQNFPQEIDTRFLGLGDIDRKHLSRAEKLIAIGFHEAAADQLLQISTTEDRPAFMFYLSRLLNQAGRYQESIVASWQIARQNKAMTSDLARVLFPQAFIKVIETSAQGYKIDPLLILSLMRQESAFNPQVISSAKAVGLMQLMPATARQVAESLSMDSPDAEQLKIPQTNIKLGTEYLSKLLTIFDDNLVYAVAAYNAGPNKVKEWLESRSELSDYEFIESIPYKETRGYVKKVLSNYAVYTALRKDRDENSVQPPVQATIDHTHTLLSAQ